MSLEYLRVRRQLTKEFLQCNVDNNRFVKMSWGCKVQTRQVRREHPARLSRTSRGCEAAPCERNHDSMTSFAACKAATEASWVFRCLCKAKLYSENSSREPSPKERKWNETKLRIRILQECRIQQPLSGKGRTRRTSDSKDWQDYEHTGCAAASRIPTTKIGSDMCDRIILGWPRPPLTCRGIR